MVSSRALAIMVGLLWRKNPIRFWQSHFSPRSGRESAATEALLTRAVCAKGRRTVGWAVRRWRKETTRGRQKWRAEVGPRLPGGRPRLLELPSSAKDSFERLVFAEVGNREAQRVDGDQFVGYVILEDEDKISGIEIALELGVVGGLIVDKIEINAGAI